MGTITLSVPDELKKRMDRTDWVNWSSVARRAFAETLEDVQELEAKKNLARVKEIISKSKLTEKDAKKIGDKISLSMHERYKKKFKELS